MVAATARDQQHGPLGQHEPVERTTGANMGKPAIGDVGESDDTKPNSKFMSS